MLKVTLSGWAQCRLATNPDPHDDPRGTRSSFRQFAYAGEPDLDRIIRFNDPPFQRTHTRPIGVRVNGVSLNDQAIDDHALIGAPVNLIDDPVFEGRNGVIATDVAEPIYPVHLSIGEGTLRIQRRIVPKDDGYPFDEFFPVDAGGPGRPGVPEAFGEFDHRLAWEERIRHLTAALPTVSADERPGIAERLAVLEALPPIISIVMHWRFMLNGEPSFAGDGPALLGAEPDPSASWTLDFRFGAWDADAQSFLCIGSLSIPTIAMTG